MKLQNNSIGTLSQGFESKDISVVSVNADALEIVSQMFQNDIYSNKLEAAIRETTANAIDEHIKYNVDRDVEINLETVKNETWLSVRDFAKGLDEKDLREVFGGLFCSTKNLTNSATGGFGIGAKSPICYAESFIVTSFFNKKKTSFVFYRDRGVTGSSITKIAKFNEEETNESSGIEVRIPIQNADVEKANTITKNFVQDLYEESKVVYVNHFQSTIRPVKEKVWNIGNFKVCQKDIQNDYSISIRMGSIVYRLPDFFDLNNNLFSNSKTLIDVPIGTFSMPPSRETLSDVPENIKKWNLISSQILDFYNKTKSLVKLTYEDLTSNYLEAECFRFRITEDFKIPRCFSQASLIGKTKKVVALFERRRLPHWSRRKIDYFIANNSDCAFIYAYVNPNEFKEHIDKIKSIDNSIECITEKNSQFRIPKEKSSLKQEFSFIKKEYEYSRTRAEKYSIEEYIKQNPIPENFDLQKVSNIKELKKVCITISLDRSITQTDLNHCCKTAFDILIKQGYYSWNDERVKNIYNKLLRLESDLKNKKTEVSFICSNAVISNRSKRILNKLVNDSLNVEKINMANFYVNKLQKGLQKISEKSVLHKKLVDRSSHLCYNGFDRKEIKYLIKNIA
jgi:anti-sigma regulatory factor (Ser/Thr protein kinase)